jgi:hypothetical protein
MNADRTSNDYRRRGGRGGFCDRNLHPTRRHRGIPGGRAAASAPRIAEQKSFPRAAADVEVAAATGASGETSFAGGGGGRLAARIGGVVVASVVVCEGVGGGLLQLGIEVDVAKIVAGGLEGIEHLLDGGDVGLSIAKGFAAEEADGVHEGELDAVAVLERGKEIVCDVVEPLIVEVAEDVVFEGGRVAWESVGLGVAAAGSAVRAAEANEIARSAREASFWFLVARFWKGRGGCGGGEVGGGGGGCGGANGFGHLMPPFLVGLLESVSWKIKSPKIPEGIPETCGLVFLGGTTGAGAARRD